jgi:hypothetical protein
VQQQQQQLNQQQRDLASLRAQLGQQQLSRQQTEQVRQLVREVIADADTRKALIEQQLVAGYDKGFFLASADGNNLLRIRGLLETRYVYNNRDDSAGDDSVGGFEIARTRFGFIGHVIDPSWQYMIWTGHHFNGDAMLLDAWIKKDLGNGFSVKAGQFKIPLWREWLVSETKQQFIERSLITATLSGKYTQGVAVNYAGDCLRATVSINDGTSNLNETWDHEDTDIAVSGRVEGLIAGDWSRYAQWQSWPGEQGLMLIVGAAAHHQQGEHGTNTDEMDITRWTIDGSAEFGGANLFAAVLGSHEQNGMDRDQYAALLQGGYFVTQQVELIGRYEWGDADQTVDETLSVATAGINVFFADHAARWTLDLSYAFEPVNTIWASSFAGFLPDAAGQEGQVVVRTQLQLTF